MRKITRFDIADAVLAERERCASVIRDLHAHYGSGDIHAWHVEHMIRSIETPEYNWETAPIPTQAEL
jgi:hypothetical protein